MEERRKDKEEEEEEKVKEEEEEEEEEEKEEESKYDYHFGEVWKGQTSWQRVQNDSLDKLRGFSAFLIGTI